MLRGSQFSFFFLDAPSLDSRLEHLTSQVEVHCALRSFASALSDGLVLHLLHLERPGTEKTEASSCPLLLSQRRTLETSLSMSSLVAVR